MTITRSEYLEQANEELGKDFSDLFASIDNEYYALVESEIKRGNTINKEIYDSLSNGQKYHFNKHYNGRLDKIA